MRMNMVKALVLFVAAICIVFLPAAASAQDNPGANLGAVVTTDAGAACQGDASCLAALQQCRDDLKTSTETAKDALEKLNKCQASLKPPVKPQPLPPPVCGGPYMNVSDCTCRLNADGSGEKNPLLVRVRPYNTNTVVCVTQAALLDMVDAMNRRILAIEGKVPGWDDAKRKIDTLLILVSNGQPEAFATQWTELLSWYRGAQQSLAQIQQTLVVLVNNDSVTQQSLSKLCPPIPDRPQAQMPERCDYAARQGRGTQVAIRPVAEGFIGHRPEAGAHGGVAVRGEIEYNLPNSQSAIVTSIRFGHIWDQDTGRQLMVGGEAGYRYYISREKNTSLDFLAYGQQYYSVHPAGYQTMPEKGMGWEAGGRFRVGHCVTEAFCFSGDVGVGGTPRVNYWRGAYDMSHGTGITANAGLGIHGRIRLF